MKKVFKKRFGIAKGTKHEKTNEKYMRGNTFYTATGLEFTSTQEKINNALIEVRDKNYHKFFGK